MGLSKRTDEVGASELSIAFPEYRFLTIDIKASSESTLHLKSACSMCGPNHVLVGGELGKIIGRELEFSRHCSSSCYKISHVPDTEAANCVYVNGVLIRRSDDEFPNSKPVFDKIGGKQIQVTASELAKVDGALTCCSLLF